MVNYRCKCLNMDYSIDFVLEYQLDQLPEDARENAMKKLRDIAYQDDCQFEFDCEMDNCLNELQVKGWGVLTRKDCDWEIHGGCDYFHLKYIRLDLRKLAKAYALDIDEYHIEQLRDFEGYIEIDDSDHIYMSEDPDTVTYPDRWLGCRCVHCLDSGEPNRIALRWLNTLMERLQFFYDEECHRIKRNLVEAIEYPSTDEAIMDKARDLDYRFDSDGNRID